MDGRRILVDVRSLLHFATFSLELTGIQRVELALAEELAKFNHQAVVWDEQTKTLRAIDIGHVRKVIDRSLPDVEGYLRAPQLQNRSEGRSQKMLGFYSVVLVITPPFGSLRRRLALKVAYLFGKTHRELSSESRQRIVRRLKLMKRLERMSRFLAGARDVLPKGSQIRPEAGDIFLSVSILPQDDCVRYLSKNGISIIPFIYDLYPVLQPHLVQNAGVIGQLWEKRLAIYSRQCPQILTCSDSTKRDLLRWFLDNDLSAPKIATVPLAPGLNVASKKKAPDRFPFTAGFALLVGSFGPNKNQAWAHMLWSRLIEKGNGETIPLVFAGRSGWRATDTIESIKQDRYYGRFLHVVEMPSDEEMAWLYANCSFLIQPSETEGWGLPVSEGLAFGKPCLTSGRGALKESGQGLAWEADTLDGQAWLEKVLDWTRHPEKIVAEQARISSSYVKRDWNDAAREILDAISVHPRASDLDA